MSGKQLLRIIRWSCAGSQKSFDECCLTAELRVAFDFAGCGCKTMKAEGPFQEEQMILLEFQAHDSSSGTPHQPGPWPTY